MADILLAHCNHLYYDRKQVRKMEPYPPLQTLIAAELLRRAGFGVALFDATFQEPEGGFRAALKRHRPAVVALCEDNFNFLTKMCLTRNRQLAFAMCAIAREQNIPVLVNSSDSTQRVALYLRNGADCVVLGELEETLLEAVDALMSDEPDRLEGVRGLAYAAGGSREIRRNPLREPLGSLDQLPMPAWDLVDMESYRAAWLEAHGYFTLNLISSRGCPFECNWCARPIHGTDYRSQSAARVAEEMRRVKDAYAPDRIWFADDIFAFSAAWARVFSSEVQRLEASLPFKMQSRCDLMIPETVAALKSAGCAEVWLGAESGSQKILDAMEKGIVLDDIRHARENLRLHGIRTCYFLQFGYPGESWEDIRRTLELVRETEPDDVGISVSYPLPGTEFYRRVSAQLGSKQNWDDSEDLAMMFQGTYTNGFYRALHDAIHLEIEARRAAGGRPPDPETLRTIWSGVEELRKSCLNPSPTALWTSS